MRPPAPKPIVLTKAQRADATARLSAFLNDEFDQEISALQAEMLLDFIGERLGPVFYSRGLQDAQDLIRARTDDLIDGLYGLEREPPALG